MCSSLEKREKVTKRTRNAVTLEEVVRYAIKEHKYSRSIVLPFSRFTMFPALSGQPSLHQHQSYKPTL